MHLHTEKCGFTSELLSYVRVHIYTCIYRMFILLVFSIFGVNDKFAKKMEKEVSLIFNSLIRLVIFLIFMICSIFNIKSVDNYSIKDILEKLE